MKIVADENIPLVEYYFGGSGKVILKSGRLITREDVRDADILLVRSVTPVNKKLLEGAAVKFVGSATAGADHMDTEWLEQAGIDWSIAAGCNANAVAEYVVCVIEAIKKQGFLAGSHLRAGVIGVGHVGRLVVNKLINLGFDVIQCDPFRSETDEKFSHTALDYFSDLDFISVHTPLTYQGKFPTYHLVDKNFLARQKKGCILLNAGRGDVVSFDDLKRYGRHLHWCFDVWEHEPEIDFDVLKASLIATPHIAGYSLEAKLRGVEMIYEAALKKKKIAPVSLPHPVWNHGFDFSTEIFDPLKTTLQMKKSLLEGLDTFDHLRKNFPERRGLE